MRAVFDAGAQLILGHHPHIPKGIEVIDGNVCFHSLGHFIFSSDSKPKHGHTNAPRHGVEMDPEYPHLPFGKDGQRSLIAKALVSQNGLEQASFLPVRIDKLLRPEVLTSDDQRFAEEVRYLEWCSQNLPHEFRVAGDEVVVS
jgi:poly-gamma-glutamate synthesis protein (capsule biosynthesis protein)